MREGQPTCPKKGKLISDLPVICVLAIKGGSFNYKEALNIFHEKINDLEPQVYEKANSLNENMTDKIHRLQFGILNISSNSQINKQILRKVDKKNPKIIIHISSLNLIAVVNNLRKLKRGIRRFH